MSCISTTAGKYVYGKNRYKRDTPLGGIKKPVFLLTVRFADIFNFSMKTILILPILLAITAIGVQGQDKNAIAAEFSSELYCVGWLNKFPDTIQIFTHFDSIPKLVDYSVIRKNEKGYYDLLLWEGKVSIIDPTELKDKLNLTFKDNIVIFKLGHVKCGYIIHRINGHTMLIKQNPNDHRKVGQGKYDKTIQI